MALDNFIWYEKYRPRCLDAVIMPPATRSAMEAFLAQGEIPHLLLHGPAGSGKTSVAKILTEQLSCTVLELNASSGDRGIEIMKTKVKQFASSSPMPGRELKIAFFDEADGITPDAQKSLRNTIETYQASCRFLFTCNHFDKMHDAIISRCMCFEFSQFPMAEMKRLACKVLRQEQVDFDRAAVGQLVERFYPDFRSIFNYLHMGSLSGSFTSESIASLNIDLGHVISLLTDGKISDMRRHWAGVSDFTFLYKGMFDELVPLLAEQDNSAAAATVITLANYLSKDSTIPDRELNFSACCLEIMRQLSIAPNFV